MMSLASPAPPVLCTTATTISPSSSLMSVRLACDSDRDAWGQCGTTPPGGESDLAWARQHTALREGLFEVFQESVDSVMETEYRDYNGGKICQYNVDDGADDDHRSHDGDRGRGGLHGSQPAVAAA